MTSWSGSRGAPVPKYGFGGSRWVGRERYAEEGWRAGASSMRGGGGRDGFRLVGVPSGGFEFGCGEGVGCVGWDSVGLGLRWLGAGLNGAGFGGVAWVGLGA